MKEKKMDFGELILKLRRTKNWTVRELIKRLEDEGHKAVSPAYITRIEQYGEIPNPEFICKLADVFQYDQVKMINNAKQAKIEQLDQRLQKKYQEAVGLYRTQKKRK